MWQRRRGGTSYVLLRWCVKIIHKTPYARIAYFRPRRGLVVNIAVFRCLRKELIFKPLYAGGIVKAISLDAICVILVCNMRHFGSQYASYYPAICGKLSTNMPSITSKEMICEATMRYFWMPEAPFSVFSACRMPKKVDGVLSRKFTA